MKIEWESMAAGVKVFSFSVAGHVDNRCPSEKEFSRSAMPSAFQELMKELGLEPGQLELLAASSQVKVRLARRLRRDDH